MENNYQEKIVEALRKASEPRDIEKIRNECGIGNWNTALKHCLELVISEKIHGKKTSKSWIFWVDHTCKDCSQWAGRCLKGHVGKVAGTPACDVFGLKNSVEVRQVE